MGGLVDGGEEEQELEGNEAIWLAMKYVLHLVGVCTVVKASPAWMKS